MTAARKEPGTKMSHSVVGLPQPHSATPRKVVLAAMKDRSDT